MRLLVGAECLDVHLLFGEIVALVHELASLIALLVRLREGGCWQEHERDAERHSPPEGRHGSKDPILLPFRPENGLRLHLHYATSTPI
ncbi:hypothetical protein D3C83_08890 [compost metagenome]